MKNTKLDYLIIGQGIAGSILAYTLLKAHKKILIVDPFSPYNASRAASGVCNPITGRRLVKTWMADQLFPYLHQFYEALEEELGINFCYQKEVYRTFDSIKEQNEWSANQASAEWANYTNRSGINHQIYEQFIHNDFGGWQTKGARFILVERMISSLKDYFQQKGIYQKDFLDHQDVKVITDGISWKDYQASRVIFCEGAYVIANPYFNYLPHRPDKGEWIKIKIQEDIPLYNLIKKMVFIIPLGNREYLISGTYHKGDLSYQVTEKARNELMDKLDKVFKFSYKVIDQRAGIRAATRDRKPYIGTHPIFPQLGIFNGLGTKGLSLAPYLAKHFYGHLEFDAPLLPEIDIKRFQEFFGVKRN